MLPWTYPAQSKPRRCPRSAEPWMLSPRSRRSSAARRLSGPLCITGPWASKLGLGSLMPRKRLLWDAMQDPPPPTQVFKSASDPAEAPTTVRTLKPVAAHGTWLHFPRLAEAAARRRRRGVGRRPCRNRSPELVIEVESKRFMVIGLGLFARLATT